LSEHFYTTVTLSALTLKQLTKQLFIQLLPTLLEILDLFCRTTRSFSPNLCSKSY